MLSSLQHGEDMEHMEPQVAFPALWHWSWLGAKMGASFQWMSCYGQVNPSYPSQIKTRPTDWTFRPISSPYHLRTMIPTFPPSIWCRVLPWTLSIDQVHWTQCLSFEMLPCSRRWLEEMRDGKTTVPAPEMCLPLLDLGQYQWSQYWIDDARTWYISIPTKSICFHLFLGFEWIRSAWFSLISGKTKTTFLVDKCTQLTGGV